MNIFNGFVSRATLRDMFLILFGTFLATFGQILMFYFQGKRETRSSKKTEYSEFLSAFSHGIRINIELMQIESQLSELEENQRKRGEELSQGLKNEQLESVRKEEEFDRSRAKSLGVRMESLRKSLEIYLERIDKSISILFLVAPWHISMLARLIRDGLDQWRETQEYVVKMSIVNEQFAKALQRDTASVWLGRFHVYRRRHQYKLWFKEKELPEISRELQHR